MTDGRTAQWVREFGPEIVVMESTGIYWKSPFAALEREGIIAWVVNARHVKNVPGRKTDVADAQWLATLARSGLLHGSFIPPATYMSVITQFDGLMFTIGDGQMTEIYRHEKTAPVSLRVPFWH